MNDPGRNNYPPAMDYPPPGSVISSGSHGRGPPPPGSGQTSPPPPLQTSITVNTDATPGGQVTEINLNLGYFKTLPGILKLVQLVSFEINCTTQLVTDVPNKSSMKKEQSRVLPNNVGISWVGRFPDPNIKM